MPQSTIMQKVHVTMRLTNYVMLYLDLYIDVWMEYLLMIMVDAGAVGLRETLADPPSQPVSRRPTRFAGRGPFFAQNRPRIG
jgi:hypothetical protein